jgi:DNA polymerase-1
MTMAHLLNPLRPKGLKPLAGMYVDSKAVAAQRLLDEAMADNKWTWATVPVDFPYYWIYGAMDPVLTCHLADQFEPQISASYQDVYDLELNTLRVVTNMMLKGARVNLDYSSEKMDQLMTWSAQARSWLASTYGLANATSNPQVIKALQAEGVTLPNVRTKSGAQSLDKEVLQTIVAETQHPIAQYVLAIRKAEKTVGPYFKNFMELADPTDEGDLLHPTIWSMGTRTARMSIQDPALQTLPRKDPTVRNAFIARQGNGLITCDYDQIEARLAAHFAQDQAMCNAFSDGDFFYALASQIFGLPVEQIEKEMRQLTKNTTYGKLYGAGPPKMAQTAGVPLDQMLPVVQGFDRAFPGIQQLQRKINETARYRQQHEGAAYIVTPRGRRLLADDDKEYTLTNYLIQSHAAEILKQALVTMDAAGLGDYMILPVHDEVVFDVPLDLHEEVLPIIEACMSNRTDYMVPITASPEVIDGAWGSKYE